MKRQAGLTLIEFMVAVVMGMLLVAAIATLIANQSTNRAEVDRSGKMIENGRYAVGAIAADVQMAGYWGELSSDPSAPISFTTADGLPSPCNLTVAVTPADPSADTLENAMGVAVQGYDSPSTLPAALSGCVSNHKSGTDILVVRRLDPDTSAIVTGGNMDLSKLTSGQVYVQTGLDATSNLTYKIAAANSATNATTFTLTKKTATTLATLRKYQVHIYYISTCSVEVSGSCTNADGGTPIPTLKRVELGAASGSPAFSKPTTLAEGIENMQIDYGEDTNADGMPDTDTSGTPGLIPTRWAAIMSLKVYLLARSVDTTPGHTDTKTYALGSATPASAANDNYKRHVFAQSVRLVNPSGRRAL